jgi:hypothetical protein
MSGDTYALLHDGLILHEKCDVAQFLEHVTKERDRG